MMYMKHSLTIVLLFMISLSSRPQQWNTFGNGLPDQVHAIIRHNNQLWVGSDYPYYYNGTDWTAAIDGLLYPLGVGVVFAYGILNNVLYMGGFFTVLTPEGNWYNNVARLHNGSWTTCGNGQGIDGSGMDGNVYCMIVYNGNLYAGGAFGSAGGDPLYPQEVRYIARFDGNAWQPVGLGVNDKITDMIVYNGVLVVSGYFTEAGGVPANHIAYWNGISWHALGSGMNGKVTALAVHDGYLYAGGLFDTAGGQYAKNIAKWDGTNWAPVGEGLNGQVYTLASYDGKLFAGGNELKKTFLNIPPFVVDYHLLYWNGSVWDTLNKNPNGQVNYLFVDEWGLIIGGNFSSVGNITANNIVQYKTISNVEEKNKATVPTRKLISGYPNPFNHTATISFYIPSASAVSIKIFNTLGEEVTTILNEKLPKGYHERQWEASKIPSGIYFCKLEAGELTETIRWVVSR